MSTSTVRILFIEDSEDDYQLVVRVLKKAGLSIISERVETLDRMMAVLSSGEWDLIISDFAMPHFTGFAALAALKNARPDLPFILVSGMVGEEIAVEAILAGADDYVLKDNLTRLPLAVERELKLRRERLEQQNTKHKVSRLEDRLWSIIEMVPDVLWSLEVLDGRLGGATFLSPACKDMTGYSPADLYRDAKLRAEVIAPECRERVFSTLQDIIQSKSRAVLSYDVIPKTGGKRAVEDFVRPALDSKGTVIALHGIARDVTERRRLEHDLKTQEERLQHAQKLEAVGLLSGGVAHDFNNIITGISLNAESVLAQLDEKSKFHEELNEILKATVRASTLVRQLMFFGRKQPAHPKVVDINLLLSDLLKMLRRIIGDGIILNAKFDPELWPISADAGQIEQVLVNLVVNARDAMSGEGDLEILTINREVVEEQVCTTGKLAAGRYAGLEVMDSGHGMDDQTVMRIFEPYFTTKEAGKGTGLGLATVYGIVRKAGGQIDVASKVGKGTRFSLYFPETREQEAQKPVASSGARSLEGSETLLLVDDDAVVRRGLVRGLRASGYQVLEARDGQEASRVLAACQEPVHVMVTDIMMPGVNGLELASQLQSLRPNIGVVFMSGQTGPHSEIIESFRGDRIRFLPKPFRIEMLLQSVRDLMDTAGTVEPLSNPSR